MGVGQFNNDDDEVDYVSEVEGPSGKIERGGEGGEFNNAADGLKYPLWAQLFIIAIRIII